MSTAVKTTSRKGRASGGNGSTSADPGRGQESKAEHCHEYDVPVECEAYVRLRLFAAQDQDGSWYASDSLQVGGERLRDSAVAPATAPKFESERMAVINQVERIDSWLALGEDSHHLGEIASTIGQALASWREDVHKHITARDLAEKTEAAAAKRKDGGSAARKGGTAVPHSKERTIVSIPVDKIQRHPHNRTVDKPGCQTLAESLQRRGLLQPVLVRPIADPVGHYQLIDGERRWWAAQIAGWDTIDAEVREMGDPEAEAAIAAANGQRKELDDIQRADRLAWLQRPVSEGGGGLNQTAAAAEMGISQPTASLLESVGQLPECWRKAIIAGEITASQLRPVARYAQCQEVLKILWKDYVQATKSGDPWELSRWASRQAIEETIKEVLVEQTRPLTPHDGFGTSDYHRPKFVAAKLDEGEEQKLRVIKIPGPDRKMVSRCLDVPAWRKLQEDASPKGNGKAAAGPKAACESRPKRTEPTPAERKQAEAEQDRQLVDRIRGWGGLASIALRIDLAERLQPGQWVTQWLHDELVASCRETEASTHLDYEAWRYEAQRLLRAERLPKGHALSPPQIKPGHYRDHQTYGKYALETLDADGDPITDSERIRWHTVRLLLWPQSGVIESRGRLAKAGEYPERFPRIFEEILVPWAELAGATVRATWEAARAKAPAPARLWLLEFVRTHNTSRQRSRLAEELGLAINGGEKMQDLQDLIVTAHAERGLKLPKVLEWPKSRRPKEKGGRS